MNHSKQSDVSNPGSPSPPSPAERISFLIASTILATVISTAGYLWVRDRDVSPPILEVTSMGQTHHVNNHYYIPFTVTNMGGETAEAVQVIAELHIEGRPVEWGEQEIDFLSQREKAEGAFIFSEDPQKGSLIVRVASYKLP